MIINDTYNLNSKIDGNLSARIANSSNYDANEIRIVNEFKSALFPKDFVLDLKRNEEYRILARNAQIELKPAREIKSHRKHLGKLIVFVKKLSWPLVKIHLKESVEHMRDFSSQALYTMARQEVRLRELEGPK